ncbi:MAG: bifunctional riboflavin kinase/FAD synthetase [Clostridiales bacterium]|nr:bifunctional riboflavin kinase/FAD synthetase [Clostridiales bacterium]
METYRSISDIKAPAPASAVALGFFDGLHLGHTALISETVGFAKANGLAACVFTFREHPANIMNGRLIVPRLLTEEQKLKRLFALGVDRVYDFDFADGFHTMTPEFFARTLLKDAFMAEAVFCGFNFRFGAEALGDTSALKGFGDSFGFDTHVLDPVYIAGRLVSSTLIRRCINSGDIEPAGRLLGRDYSLGGGIEEGRGLGQSFGFPTANFYPAQDLTLPAHGVYVTEALIDDVLYPAVSNIGVAPTIVSSGALRVETHLFDTNMALYGKKIEVYFKKMLRKERRFDSEDALKRQIASDTETARLYFASKNI